MNRSGFTILIFVVVIFALLSVTSQYQSTPTDSNRKTFSAKDPIKNGMKALKEVMPLLFPDATIKTSKTTFFAYEKQHQLIYEYDDQNEDTHVADSIQAATQAYNDSIAIAMSITQADSNGSNKVTEFDDSNNDSTNENSGVETGEELPYYSYLFVEDDINLSKSDARRLLAFVNQGNTVFIASSRIPYALQDSIRIYTQYEFHTLLDSATRVQKVTLLNHAIPYQSTYSIKGFLIEDHITNFDSTKATIIAKLNDTIPIALSYNYGAGKIIFTTAQLLFLNQHLVNKPERKFAYGLLNYANAYNIVWDEYYKKYNINNSSKLQFITSNKSLYAGFLAILFGVLFYMVFNSKRRQREIKVINSPENSTLNFVHVITALYRKNSQSHQDIIKQKLLHWHDVLKNKLRIDIQRLDKPSERLILSEKTGIPLDKINQICNQVKYLEIAPIISHKELAEFDGFMALFEKFK
jgi:hypothetical protein